jgi:hypothetical protein
MYATKSLVVKYSILMKLLMHKPIAYCPANHASVELYFPGPIPPQKQLFEYI